MVALKRSVGVIVFAILFVIVVPASNRRFSRLAGGKVGKDVLSVQNVVHGYFRTTIFLVWENCPAVSR